LRDARSDRAVSVADRLILGDCAHPDPPPRSRRPSRRRASARAGGGRALTVVAHVVGTTTTAGLGRQEKALRDLAPSCARATGRAAETRARSPEGADAAAADLLRDPLVAVVAGPELFAAARRARCAGRTVDCSPRPSRARFAALCATPWTRRTAWRSIGCCRHQILVESAGDQVVPAMNARHRVQAGRDSWGA